MTEKILNFDINMIKTPTYIVDEILLENNLKILKYVADKSGCKILLAQKAFSMFSMYDLIGKYLNGTTSSGLYEAKLGKKYMSGDVHIFSPAYKDDEIDEIIDICDHIIFNSFNQWLKFKPKMKNKQCGIRINPECSTQDHAIYDPCSPGSRLGVTRKNFRSELLDGISGLHFHTLCEQNADALATTLASVERNFGEYLPKMEWINFGGGHHITRNDYDIEQLIDIIIKFKNKYDIEVFLEPGEAVALNCGFLVSSVMDIVENDIINVILDTSAACHMPDVIEMPYRPHIVGSGQKSEKMYNYRFGGPTCLAGDIIGDYSFDNPLKIGDKIVFCDMAIYSMVKNNTFNGMKLPDIAICEHSGNIRVVREFGYDDFEMRLS